MTRISIELRNTDLPKQRVRCCLYSRVSTLLGQDPENQLVHLREYARTKGYEVFDEYVDKGISGAKERRPALDRLVEDARERKYTVILIAALDRISRDTRHLLNLMHELAQYNVTIVSLRENLDFGSPVGIAFLSVCGAISTLERNLCRERIRNALAAKKIQAKRDGTDWRCGRPTVVTDVLRDEILRLRREGKTISAIANALDGKASRSAVGCIVKAHPTTLPTTGQKTRSKKDLVDGFVQPEKED